MCITHVIHMLHVWYCSCPMVCVLISSEIYGHTFWELWIVMMIESSKLRNTQWTMRLLYFLKFFLHNTRVALQKVRSPQLYWVSIEIIASCHHMMALHSKHLVSIVSANLNWQFSHYLCNLISKSSVKHIVMQILPYASRY